ncbi:MAG: S9 family peptidase [Acidobacteria bacterium]|nr:S9 family peptidase [Acidobacteriota bacterium]
MTRYRFVLVAVLPLLVAPAAAFAQRPMSIVDLIGMPAVSAPQLSPDATAVAFVQADADWAANKRISHIWRARVDGTAATQLTYGEEGESGPQWAPDGRHLAFIGKRAGADVAQLHLLPMAGGEAQVLTSHATAVSNPAWSPDGRWLYFLAADPKPEEQLAREKAKDDVFAFDEDFEQRHLWRIDVTTRAESRVTSGDFSVLNYELSRDGAKIAHHRAPSPNFGDGGQSEVWLMDAAGGGALALTKNAVSESNASVSPDGSQVLFLSQANEAFETYYNANLFMVSAAGGQARDLTKEFGNEVTDAAWSKDGRAIFFIANMGVHSQLFEMPAAGGAPKALTSGNHALGGWSYAPASGRHIFTKDDPANAGDVFTTTTGAITQVSHVFDRYATEFRLPRQEKVAWKGADGVTVEGVLFYPLDYQQGQRYPLVVQTHGGPQASDKFGFGRWSNYTQVLAAKGYVVLQPNYRGSTGYGDAFLRDMVGHYFVNAHLDVMTGVDHLIAIGLVDGDRMAKMGWSGGGHMTNKIITFTNRFKAAASGAGAANWISMYAQSDVRTYRTPWFGGTPWQANAPIDTYWEHSPLKYVSKVTTPTIFLVGGEDVRVPPPQSVEMYRALKSLGVPTHLYIAPREPHGWGELRHELFKANVELDWFEKYVTKRPYAWEKAPGVDAAPATATASRQP